ncbi:MAG: FkbM family methyltransferase [Sporocytophaga sp.]|uniref:FkbM family methyltransferase n=1 Tax=Sporocytophaga sp. TaxID=2231183 RepID=UPI001AFE0078|nr:FkbM family methyltransferase [Sporocytophaga sp.]MBO9701465.1 FkbM family methyltransferase [Sporocytophaga sp.]
MMRVLMKGGLMKRVIKAYLQKLLGFRYYLHLFSLYKIYSLRVDKAEKDFLHFIKLIPKDGIILDIGANIGLMTVTLAKKFPESTVYSFEPIPYNLGTLNQNIELFKLDNVEVFPMALGNEDSEIDMVMPVVNSVKMQGLCHVIHDAIPKSSEGETFSVPLRKLDSIKHLKDASQDIVAIKLDVEHFEWAVLEGAREILDKHKPVIYCELGENENRTKSMEVLCGLGYKAKIVEGNDLVDFDQEVHKATNFIFMH